MHVVCVMCTCKKAPLKGNSFGLIFWASCCLCMREATYAGSNGTNDAQKLKSQESHRRPCRGWLAALLFATSTCALAALTGYLIRKDSWRWASVCLSLLLAPPGALLRWQLSALNTHPASASPCCPCQVSRAVPAVYFMGDFTGIYWYIIYSLYRYMPALQGSIQPVLAVMTRKQTATSLHLTGIVVLSDMEFVFAR
jgi:hypothetical protein